MSERRSCSVLGADRSSVRYRRTRADDAAVRTRLRDLAAVRRRFGYRRLHVLLAREGISMNHKNLRRLYREERLQVRRRGGRKRALGTRAPLALPHEANQRWSLDFLSDAFADSRRFRMPARFSPPGSSTTTRSARTAGSAICHRPNTPSSAPARCNRTTRLSSWAVPAPRPVASPSRQASNEAGALLIAG